LAFYLARMLLAREDVESKAPLLVAGDPGHRQPAESERAN
jgi:hypothetical protein